MVSPSGANLHAVTNLVVFHVREHIRNGHLRPLPAERGRGVEQLLTCWKMAARLYEPCIAPPPLSRGGVELRV